MPKRSGVDAWFRTYDNPMKPVVRRAREIILATDARVDECIKWKSPTFTFEGNLASFMPRARKHASLMFHTGAQIPGKHPRLSGSGAVARFMTFTDLADVDAQRSDLEAIVRAWIDLKAGAAPRKKVAKKKATKKKVAKKKATKRS
ncbi:MAG: DUF1801 domain-containing protein [Deltaproteobacteria bacterium]|nr:DUF1801 domain-containing protein [Deltaproteobacteria bacterium]